MSVHETSRVWKTSQHKGGALLLMLAIADNANDWGYAFPGIEYLSQKTRMSERQVRRLIELAEETGELYVDQLSRRHGYLILCGLDEGEQRERFERFQRERLILLTQIKSDKMSTIRRDKMSGKKRTFATNSRTQVEATNRQYNHHGTVSGSTDGSIEGSSGDWDEIES